MNVKWLILCLCLCLAGPVAALSASLSPDQAEGLSHDEMLRREAVRYRSQKIANPVSLHARVTGQAMSELRSTSRVASNLHQVMRVGDRIVFEPNGSSRTLWKRNREITPEFRAAVAALLKGKKVELPWQSETERRRVSVTIKSNTLAGLAFALHRARAVLPLVDLSAGQLAANGETIQRTRKDGTITLLIEGGAGLQIPGTVLKIGKNLHLARITAGNGPLVLRWQNSPDQLLAISDSSSPFSNLAAVGDLQIQEKRILSIVKGAQVKSFIRLSSGPAYKGWQRQEFAPSGPLSAQLDLSRDEVGPHDRSGKYQRLWIVTCQVDGGLTQRQVASSYTVIEKKKKFGSDKFLRRDGLGDRPE
ncbi:MAG: hypothetical protein PHO83_13195 [Geobacteraceae bacterium]|nr:hypothetical protein [Geobacteraceae bacterium]